MNAAREARQHGRRGAPPPATLQALSRSKVLQYKRISLSCCEARHFIKLNFIVLNCGASRPGRNFRWGGGIYSQTAYARETKNCCRSDPEIRQSFMPSSLGLRISVTQGGYPQKLHSRVAA